MDWNNFDFSKDEKFDSKNDPIAQEALDVDTFFKKLDGSAEEEEVEEGFEEEEVSVNSPFVHSFTVINLFSSQFPLPLPSSMFSFSLLP